MTSAIGQTPVNVKVAEPQVNALPDLDDVAPIVIKRAASTATTDTVAAPAKADAPVTAEGKEAAAAVLSNLRLDMLSRVNKRIAAGKATQPDFDKKVAWVLTLDQFSMRKIGADDEQSLAAQATKMLNGVRAADCGEAGQLLIQVDQRMKGFSMEIVTKAGGALAWFKDKKDLAASAFKQWQAQGEEINKVLDGMSDQLYTKMEVMERDIGELETSFQAGAVALKNLELSIAASSIAWLQLSNEIIPAIRNRLAADPGDQSIVQELTDAVARAHALDVQIGELGKSWDDVGTHMPTVRLMQQTNADLISGMENVRTRTMSRWRRVFAQAKVLHIQKTNAEALKTMADRDAALAVQAANNLKGNATAARQIIEDGTTSYESLELAQNAVIDTITEVMEIQRRAAANRILAENKMLEGTRNMAERLRTIT